MAKPLMFIFAVFTTSCLFGQKKWIQEFEVFAGIGTIKNAAAGATFELPKASWMIGAGAAHSFTKLFELNVRIASELKGFKINETIYNPNTKQDETIELDRDIYCVTAFAIPTFRFGKKNQLKLGIGPYFSIPYHVREYRTDRDQSGNITFQSSSGGSNLVPTDVKNDYGVHLSLGYQFRLNNRNSIVLQITNSYGLAYYTNAFGRDLLNNISSVIVSYRFKRKSSLE